jgi:pyrrolidone-carboxylate peptidase
LELTDANGNKYFKFHIHIQGLDTGTPTANALVESSQVIGLHPAPVTVYSARADRMVFTSEAFANMESLDDGEDNYEEEMRLDSVPMGILAAETTMNGILLAFDSNLSAITDDKAALKAQVEASAKLMWNQAVAYNAAAPYDDRPVYWARLHANVAIKNHPFVKKQRKLRKELVAIMEGYSRGRESVDFTGSNPAFTGVPGLASAKKILVTGFDPFMGSDSYNPSGLVALALHNQVVTVGPNTGIIQAALFPVRYKDFNRGVVEEFVEEYLTNGDPNQVNMLMTISLYGGGFHYYLERFATRRRGDTHDNMNKQPLFNNSGFGGSWPRYLETTLPRPEIVPATPGFSAQEIYYNQSYNNMNFPIDADALVANVPYNLNTDLPLSPSGAMENGSGGNFLSNEIFYRVARMRTKLGSSTKTGHLHIPERRLAQPPRTDAQHVQVVLDAIKRSLSVI